MPRMKGVRDPHLAGDRTHTACSRRLSIKVCPNWALCDRLITAMHHDQRNGQVRRDNAAAAIFLLYAARDDLECMTARHTALQACDTALASPSMFASPQMFALPSGKDLLSKLQTVCRKLQDAHRCRVIEHIEETVDTLERKLGETDSKKLERITQARK